MNPVISNSKENDDRSFLGELVDPNVKIAPGKLYFSNVEELKLGKSWKKKDALSIGDVKELWKIVKERNDEDGGGQKKRVYLNELLMGSEINIPSLEIPERNPELEKRITALKNQLDEQEYHRMTRNVDTTTSAYKKTLQDDSIGSQMKQMNSAIVAALQFVISLAAAFFFGFSGVELFVGSLELPVRLLLGIAAAVIVGAAELYILVAYLDTEEAIQDEKKRKNTTTGKVKEN